MRVTLNEEPFAGSYIVDEEREDGTLVLRPDNGDYSATSAPEADRRIDEIAARHGETLQRLAGD